MAKIMFLQNIWVDLMGSMWVSSFIKSKGHSSRIVIETNVKKIFEEIKYFSPQVIGFSCMTGMHIWALNVAKLIKEHFKEILIVFGGPHATFYPKVIEYPQVDIICRGEGELPILELLDALDKNQQINNILNLWVKENGKIIENETRHFIDNLDEIPYPDRSHYDRYDYFRKNTMAHFITSRGCPYNCSFCFNHAMARLQKGEYIRYRSPLNVIEEIIEYKRKYPLERVHFHDDTFILNERWLFEFLELYRKYVNLPFHCNLRANLVNERIIYELKKSNCFAVSFGIEHGNEYIRKNLLKKDISNEQIINTASLLHKYGIKFKTFNMIGFPNETLEDAFESITLNQKIKTDYPWCSIFTPYPGTELGDFTIKNGFVDKKFNIDNIPVFYLEKSVIKQKDINKLVNLQKFFYLAVKFPYTFPLIKQLIKLPLTKIYNMLFSIFYLYSYIYKLYEMKLSEMIRFIFYMVKSLKSSKK